MIEVLQSEEVIDTLFDLINDKMLTKTYALCLSCQH